MSDEEDDIILSELNDEDLVAQATREMEILGLCDPAKVVSGAVVRQEEGQSSLDKVSVDCNYSNDNVI